jgi:hypothetical protein
MTTSHADDSADSADRLSGPALQEAAHRHMWLHFTRMSSYHGAEVPVIVRGSGQYVYDQHGKRYLDGLSGLFVSQIGHGRKEVAEAAARQGSELAYFPLWSYAHPRAIELAERLAGLAPGDLNRVFFTTSGSEAVESAWKLAKQYFKIIGQPGRYKVLSRDIAYHGTSMGALAITGCLVSRSRSSRCRRAGSGCRIRTSTALLASWPTICRRSAGGPPMKSSARSCAKVLSRWPRCSSSPCRTRAAVSRRRPAISPGCARSAIPTG